jgi:hypothetical protein
MSENIEKFADEDLQGQGASSDQASPVSTAKSIAASPDGEGGGQREYKGHCGNGICSLNWKPLRPAA